MPIQIDTSSVISVVASGTILFAFSSVRSYVKKINTELVTIRLEKAKYEAIIDRHIVEFRDVWQKVNEVDKHLEHTDKEVSQLKERTKDL